MFRKTSVAYAALGLASVLVVAACSPTRYAYAPVTTTGADIVGRPAADYAFPPDSPHGRVRLATFGIAQTVRDGPWYFHVRMNATNRGSEPWTVDRNEQTLEIAAGDDGERRTRVRAAVTAEAVESPARVEVAPGTSGEVDLFFPLPPGARDPREVSTFEVIWVVRESGRATTMATPFERFLASGPARDVPRPHPNYPYGEGTPRRLPGTPDSRWPQPEPIPDPTLVPRQPLP
jgi:hypothetical protein